MPRGTVKIVKANHKAIILEAVMSSDGRFGIPKSIRNLVKPGEKVKVTIEKIDKEEALRKHLKEDGEEK